MIRSSLSIALAAVLLSSGAAYAGYNKPAAASAPASETAAAPQTIVDVAVSNSSFETLVAALKAADLVETLSGEGPFTVFAPTDEAFAALPAGTLEKLLDPANKETLVQILTYHN